jgi:hypothetical protein
MYSVPPMEWLPVRSRDARSSVQAAPTSRIATAWLESRSRPHVHRPAAARSAERLHRNRKFARP